MMTDFAVLNSATKYPSIQTYHELSPANGCLLGNAVPFPDGAILTEKVDGTSSRIVLMPDNDWLIGSREELLYARGDRIVNPALSIVPALLPLAQQLGEREVQAGGGSIVVFFLEVYGHRVGPSARQYTGSGALGCRLFDIAEVPPVVLRLSRESASSWRENGGQLFAPEDSLREQAGYWGIPLVPRLGTASAASLPSSLESMSAFLRERLPASLAALDEGAQGGAEGIVLRSPDRSVIAKARFADYDRTFRKQQEGARGQRGKERPA